MTAITKRRGFIAAAAAVGLALLLSLLVFTGVTIAGSTPDPKGFACTDVTVAPTFLAYNAETRGDNFGPKSIATTVDEAKADLHARRCTDAALVTAHAAYYGVGGLKLPLSQDAFEAAVNAAMKAPATVWRDRVKAVEDYEASATLSITTSKARYDTLFFRKGDSTKVVPALYAGPVGDRVSTLLVIRHGNVTKELKLECGFQPFEQKFPGTTGHRPPAPKPHPTPTPTPTPSQSCPPSMPHGHWPLCKDDPSKGPEHNTQVPDAPKGSGVPGPKQSPTDSPCGYAVCATPSPSQSTPPSGGGPTTMPPPTEAPVTPSPIATQPPADTPIPTPPPAN